MSDPATVEDYALRFRAAFRQLGGTAETRQVLFPCPFCAARDWYVVGAQEFGVGEMAPHYCVACGRSARFVFSRGADGMSAELVQCFGPAPPAWMVPTPRREDVQESVVSKGRLESPPPPRPELRRPPPGVPRRGQAQLRKAGPSG